MTTICNLVIRNEGLRWDEEVEQYNGYTWSLQLVVADHEVQIGPSINAADLYAATCRFAEWLGGK